MKIVLLSGGVGKRLWPISTEEIPKQYIKLKHNETMLMSTYKKVSHISDSIYVATQKTQSDIVRKQLGNKIPIIDEPSLRGTFGAIMNITEYLKYKENILGNEIIVAIPVDHSVSANFYDIIKEIPKYLSDNADFCIIGIKPKYASTQFGYMIEKNNIVINFVEKPTEQMANELINNGAYWNSGILAFRLMTTDKILSKYLDITCYEEFSKKYNSLPKNSFDKEILEKSKKICMIKSNEQWDDLGTWNHLSDFISNSDEYNTNIINTENKKILNNGVKDSIIINTSNGIALYPKNDDRVHYSTGYSYKDFYHLNSENDKFKIKYLKFDDNKSAYYQNYSHCDEIWNVISGSGLVTIDKKTRRLEFGVSLKIAELQKLHLKEIKKLEVIGIQKV